MTTLNQNQGAPAAKLAVLVSAGDTRFDPILAGTVGTIDANRRFSIDPDYQRINYLFTLAAGSMLPAVRAGEEVPLQRTFTGEAEDGVEAVVAEQRELNVFERAILDARERGTEIRAFERVVELELDAGAAGALKSNLLALSASRWTQLYEQVGRFSGAAFGGLGPAMLEQEKANVAAAVERYLQTSGLPKWNVPIIYRGTVYQEDPAMRPQTEAGLLQEARSMDGMPLIDVTRMPEPFVAPAELAMDATVVPPAPDLPAQTRDHLGALNLVIEGQLPVYARSADEAFAIGSSILAVAAASPHTRQMLKFVPQSIQAIEHRAPTPSEEEMDEDDDAGFDRMR